jgi:hypothetical protein
MYYLPPTPIEVISAAPDRAPIALNSSLSLTRIAPLAQSPNRYGDDLSDIAEGLRIARATPNYMKSLSRMELIYAEYGQPVKVERVNDRLPDFVKPYAHWWLIRARHGTPIAYIRVLFNTSDRYHTYQLFRVRE